MAKIIEAPARAPESVKVETLRGGVLVRNNGYTYVTCSSQESTMKAVNIETGGFIGKGTLVIPVPEGEVIALISEKAEVR